MSAVRRLAFAALALAVVAAGFLLLSGGDEGYRVRAELPDAGGLLKGANVRVDGVPVGKVAALDVTADDRVIAELQIDDESLVPIGRDARLVIEADGLFGERFVALAPGDVSRPARAGSTIPKRRTSVSVRLDDLVDAIDLPTRDALEILLREQGVALAGRGQDLGTMLAALPPTLSSTGELVREFARDNRALGRLLDESDRVVASVARERDDLGRFVDSAGRAFDVLATRRAELGETVRRAPATLAAARRALASLEGAAVPLIPAARGLRTTAPRLTDTLQRLPGFSRAAIPTLRSIRDVAPLLGRLSRGGTPIVRRIAPLARELVTYASAANPFFDVLDRGTADLFGVMEGWARSTQPRDNASHLFRFGASTSTDTFGALLGDGPEPADPPTGSRRRASSPQPAQRRAGRAPAQAPAAPRVPGVDDLRRGLDDVRRRLPDLGGLPRRELERVPQDLRRQLPGGGAPRDAAPQAPPDDPLLDFLLGP